MNEEFVAFLDAYRSVSRFAIDGVVSGDATDDHQRTLPIDREAFLRVLYAERSVESEIRRCIQSRTNELICFVGPRGAGKTSVAAAVCRDLAIAYGTGAFIVPIDIRVEAALKAMKNAPSADLDAYLRQRIIHYYLSHLFPYRADNPTPRVELWNFILSDRPESERPEGIFHVFLPQLEAAQRALATYRLTQRAPDATMEEWLLANHLLDAAAQTITKAVDELVDIGHVAYAARFLRCCSLQVIWIDNTDALPETLQPVAVQHLRDFQLLIGAYVSCVVAVREENVFRWEDVAEGDMPAGERRVLLEIPRDSNDHAYYPAIDMPMASPDAIVAIVRRRMDYTKAFLAQRGSAMGDAQRAGISAERYQQLLRLTAALLEMFDTEKAIFLANNCLRDLLALHRDCLGFLLRSPAEESDPPEALTYEPWYVSTLFYKWLRGTKRRYQMGVYDVVSLARDWHRKVERPLGCFLPYLLTTCVWNLSLETRGRTGVASIIPTIDDVVRRIQSLGYSEDEVFEHMYSLYFQPERREHILGVRSRTLVPSVEDLKKDRGLRIYVTYRGKCLAARAGNSFGFVAECVRRANADAEAADELGHDLIDTDAAAEAMLPDLCRIAEMHLAALREIRQKWGGLGSEWFRIYLAQFGLPQVRPYRRAEETGIMIGGVRRALQFQVLMASLISYVRGRAISKGFIALEMLYNREVLRISSEECHPGDGNEAAVNVVQELGTDWKMEQRS